MADYGPKNGTIRSNWYDNVFVPLRLLAQSLGVDPGGIGSRSGWNNAALVRLDLRGNAKGQKFRENIVKNFKAVTDVLGVEYKDAKWNTYAKAKEWVEELQSGGGASASSPADDIAADDLYDTSGTDPAGTGTGVDWSTGFADDAYVDPVTGVAGDGESTGMSTRMKVGIGVGVLALIGGVAAVALAGRGAPAQVRGRGPQRVIDMAPGPDGWSPR